MVRRVALLALLGMFGTLVQAQQAPIFEEIRTLSTGVTPVESAAFGVTAAGAYDVTLTDLGAQLSPTAPVASIKLALMRGPTVVGTLSAAGTIQFNLTVGSYVIRVIGTPGTQAGSGLFSASLRAVGAASATFAFSGTLSALPQMVPNNVRVFQGSVTIPAAGSYTVELVDLAFPQALSSASLALTAPSASIAALLNLPATAQDITSFTATAAGTYSIFALGDSPSATNAGAFAIRIRDASNAIVYSQVLAVGRVASLGNTPALVAGQHALVRTDLAFPAALLSAGALVIDSQSNLVASGIGVGTTTFSVTNPGAHEVFAVALAAAAPGGGTLAVEVSNQAGTALFSTVRTAGGDAASGTPVFAYPVDVANAGAYVATVADLQFATSLSSVSFALAQGAAVLGQASSAGSFNANLTLGRAYFLVYAVPAASSGSLQQTAGLLNARLGPASGDPIFQTTQAVGALFSSRSFVITTTGDYRFTLDDLGFPLPFAELAAAVTRGSERVGLIYGKGSFDVLQATPGTYFINFIAKLDPAAKAGTYYLAATTKPASPVVNLSANPVSPASGAGFDLSWSTQNANSCMASVAWSGERPTSGTEHIASLTAASTYKLTCTGDGGSSTANLSVTTAVPTNSGGGGRLDVFFLCALLLLGVARHRATTG